MICTNSFLSSSTQPTFPSLQRHAPDVPITEHRHTHAPGTVLAIRSLPSLQSCHNPRGGLSFSWLYAGPPGIFAVQYNSCYGSHVSGSSRFTPCISFSLYHIEFSILPCGQTPAKRSSPCLQSLSRPDYTTKHMAEPRSLSCLDEDFVFYRSSCPVASFLSYPSHLFTHCCLFERQVPQIQA